MCTLIIPGASNEQTTPQACGYDASDGMTGNNTGGMPATLGVKGGHESGPPHFIDNADPKRTPTVTDRAIAFMRKQHENKRPFYVQVSYYATHLSVVCQEQTLDKYQSKGQPDRGYTQAWAAMMEELDTGVGRFLDTLDQLSIDDTTYVFFTTDNGGRGTVPGGNTARLDTNHPLTGAKHSLYEGGIRVPFMARCPGIPAGDICHTPVVGYDFLPTFFDLGGGKELGADEVDGISIRRLLTDPQGADIARPHNALYFHRPRRKFSAIRQGDFKLMLHWNANGKVRARELYQVNPNPREQGRDISGQEPERTKSLKALLLDHLKQVNAETVNTNAPKQKKAKPKRGMSAK